MTQYKPYSPDWHRRRRLTEVLSDYFEDGVDPADIASEVVDILKEEIEFYSGKVERMEEMLKHLHTISK